LASTVVIDVSSQPERFVDARDWLLCRSGSQLFALSFADVIETMRALPVKAIAGAPAFVRGLSIIRGRPVPVIDIGRLLDTDAAECRRFVTLRAGSRTVAVATDEVVGVRAAASAAALDRLPPLLGGALDSIVAVGSLDADLLLCLQTARLVPPEVVERLDAERADA
jgi:purine-binding chemotaxis protein CheW